jgi:hypothetical protein
MSAAMGQQEKRKTVKGFGPYMNERYNKKRGKSNLSSKADLT